MKVLLFLQQKAVPLHSLNKNEATGALVQLVRMPACHAGGHESESRTHRQLVNVKLGFTSKNFPKYK